MTENQLPILYSRTSTGAIQTWQIIVTGNSYVMKSGQLDGKQTTSKPTIVKGKNIGRKNETTPEEQAILEAQSKYDKKAKTGYFPNIADIDKLAYVDPMLAKKYFERADKVVFPVIVQCKFNGSRCIITKNGAFTRKGERYETVPHITQELEGFFQEFPDAVLDGELFNHELREQLNEIMKLVRRTVRVTEDHLRASREKIRFYLYDGYNFQGLTAADPYHKRKIEIDKISSTHNFIVPVKDEIAQNHVEILAIYDAYVAENHEGAMIRFPAMTYKNGGRSSELLKVKPEDSSEGVIKAIHDGVGNWAGVAKTATILWKGLEFNATFKCDRDEAENIRKNEQNWLDKSVTFLYNGLTGLGVPNYARIDTKNCFKE